MGVGFLLATLTVFLCVLGVFVSSIFLPRVEQEQQPGEFVAKLHNGTIISIVFWKQRPSLFNLLFRYYIFKMNAKMISITFHLLVKTRVIRLALNLLEAEAAAGLGVKAKGVRILHLEKLRIPAKSRVAIARVRDNFIHNTCNKLFQ